MHSTTRATLLLLAALAPACASDRQVIAQARETHTELEPALVTDPELAGYLTELGQRVVASAQELSAQGFGPSSHRSEDEAWMFSDVEFHLVASETLNAFTTGGEHMYIYTQLMQTCGSEDELAAVMAHEYGHVYARHVHKGMQRQYAALGGAVAGGVLGYSLADDDERLEAAALGAVAAGTLASFLNMGFTRDDEDEADALGFEFYARAGWDPARFGAFFQRLADAGYDTTPEMLSDHPSLRSRVEAARVRAARLPPEASSWRRPPVADAARFEALKRRAAAVASSMSRDQSLDAARTLLSAVGNCLVPVDQPEQLRARARIQAALE